MLVLVWIIESIVVPGSHNIMMIFPSTLLLLLSATLGCEGVENLNGKSFLYIWRHIIIDTTKKMSIWVTFTHIFLLSFHKTIMFRILGREISGMQI